jgi:hypothetical protein
MRLHITITFLLILCSWVTGTQRAFYEYSFLSENDDYMLVHYWSLERVSLVQIDEIDPFTDEKNRYSYFMLIEKKSGEVIFKKRSSFFTYGWIDPDSEYIVLLSNVDMSEKIPHIALFSIEGNLLFKTQICVEECVLSFNEYNFFKKKHPLYNKKLLQNDAVSASYDLKTIYISPLYTEDETIKSFLNERSKKNHLSDCFSILNNRVFFWYFQKIIPLKFGYRLNIIGQPNIMLERSKSGNVLGISLLDPCKKRIIIPITRKNKDGIVIVIRQKSK